MIAGGYWRKSVREGDRIRAVYLGRGDCWAELAAREARAREERRARLAAEAGQWTLLREEDDRGRAVRRVVAARLNGLGFVRDCRNPWRRGMRSHPLPARRVDPAPPAPPTAKALDALRRRVTDREPGAYRELEELAKLHPYVVADEFGSDLAWLARAAYVDRVVGKDPACDFAITLRMDLLLRELAGERPGPALRLVAEVVAYAWLDHWSLATLAARTGAEATPMMIKRQTAAQRRFLAALRTYCQIAALEGGPVVSFAEVLP